MSQQIVETKRLRIEEAAVEDASFFLELLNSPNWIQFIGDRGINTEADAEDYIKESLIGSYESNGYGLYKMLLKDSNKPIGICGFLNRDYLGHPDIGFAILPKYEGIGYTYEAASSLMEYGNQELKFKTVLGITTEENKGSIQVLQRIGLSRKGTILPPNEERSLLLFSTKS